MFPEDPKDPELGTEAEELLTHWPLGDKSPAEWEELAAQIDARIKITEVGSTPDYLLGAPLLEEQDPLRRSHPRMKRPSEGSLAALAKARVAGTDAGRLDEEREALARSLLSLAVKARSETRAPEGELEPEPERQRELERQSTDLSKLVNGPSMQFLAARQVAPAPLVVTESAPVAESAVVTAGAKAGGRERSTMWFGIAFGLLGMAAAAVMYIASARQPGLAEAPVTAELKAQPQEPAPAPVNAPVPHEAAPPGEVLDVEQVPLAEAAPLTGAVPAPVAALPKERSPSELSAPARSSARAGTPAAPAGAAEAGKPAALPPAAGPSEPGMVMADSRGSLPDHPSTGAVQAAVGMVMGAARACVAGQNAASRATLSFGSDGRVQSVAVSGPAQGTGAEPCLRNALSGARVQPFARAAYSVNLSVRP